jgi:endonuclease/exonuclease/phosphatase (EEP) superfamily protein YafD
MANPKRAVAAGDFFRCGKCGTPNPRAPYLTNCLGCGAEVRPAPSAAGTAAETRVLIRPARGRFLLGASWAYAALVILALVLIRWVGDRWWGVVLLLLLPRWALLGPVAALAVASGVRRCPGHWALQAATALVIAGPLMGFSAPVRQLWERPPAGERVRLVTFNRGYSNPGTTLRDWLARERVDVVCFQEGERHASVTQALLGEGWYVNRNGMIASRFPIVEELPEFAPRYAPGERWTALLDRARVRAPSGTEFLVASAHLPTLRPAFDQFFRGDGPSTLQRHADWWGREMERVLSALAEANDLPLLVAGDFNLPSDDSTMAALRAHFRFAFDEAGWGYGYTRPTGLPWVRIDHVLAGPEWSVTSCRVGPDFGSDHLPILAELVLPPPPAPPRR